MTNTARTAADTGLPEDTRPDWSRTMEGRIAQWCDWFDVPAPDLSWRTGGEAGEGLLLDWSRDAGANLDWIICGDPCGMARLWREREVGLRQFKAAILPLELGELKLLTGIARMILEDLIDPEAALALAREVRRQHREAVDAPAERGA